MSGSPRGRPDTGRRLLPEGRDQLRPWLHITGSFRYENDIGMATYHALQFGNAGRNIVRVRRSGT